MIFFIHPIKQSTWLILYFDAIFVISLSLYWINLNKYNAQIRIQILGQLPKGLFDFQFIASFADFPSVRRCDSIEKIYILMFNSFNTFSRSYNDKLCVVNIRRIKVCSYDRIPKCIRKFVFAFTFTYVEIWQMTNSITGNLLEIMVIIYLCFPDSFLLHRYSFNSKY